MGYGISKPFVQFVSQPVIGEHDVDTGTFFSLIPYVKFGAVDPASFAQAHATLAAADGTPVGLTVKPVGTRMLLLKPAAKLTPGIEYKWSVTGLKTKTGADIPDYKANFFTSRIPDPDIAFHKVTLPNTTGYGFTAVKIGPGHKLYAGTDEGIIFRYPILPDGTLGDKEKILSLQKANGGKRLLIGFCFDPKATEADPILWVTHSWYGFIEAPDFTGKVTRMSGPNLDTIEDVVINLPRSYRDHCTNGPAFGPDGALYFPQGASNDAGAPDPIWGQPPRASAHRLHPSRGCRQDHPRPAGGCKNQGCRRTLRSACARRAGDRLCHRYPQRLRLYLDHARPVLCPHQRR